MSKAKNNIPRAAIHVGAPAKSFSAAEGYEPERRGWDENTYRLKNQDTNNHYDFSRKHLNFEIQHANALRRKVKEYFRKSTQKEYENLIFLLGDDLFYL